MAVGGLHVEDGDLGLGPRLADDLEELALAVGLHVQGDDARRRLRRDGRSATLSRAPMRANFVSRFVVSIVVPPWDGRHGPVGRVRRKTRPRPVQPRSRIML